MKHVTWILLIVVLFGQALVSARLERNERALITAVYILQAGITLDELDKLNKKYAAEQRNKAKDNYSNYRATNSLVAGNPGVTGPNAYSR